MDQVTVPRELLRQVIDWSYLGNGPEQLYHLQNTLRAALAQPAPVQEQFTRDELDLLRQWFNSMQDTNGGYVIDADRKLHEKIVAALKAAPQPQQPAVEPGHPRHPVVVRWRNDGIEACARIAEDYGNAEAACHMRTMITVAPQPQPAPVQEPFGHVTVRRLSQRFENHVDQYTFYPAGHPPYLDNVDECIPVFTAPQPAPVREPRYKTMRCAWTGKATYVCNRCGRDDFQSEHSAAFHECAAPQAQENS